MEDRTSEFRALAGAIPQDDRLAKTSSITSAGRSYGADTVSSAATGRYAALKSSPAYSELRTFHITAAGLSKDIAATSHMLAQLTQLVKQTSMFHDDSGSINDLVLRIKEKIENLNSRLDEAGQNIAVQKRRLGRNSQAGQEASNLVGQLQEEFGQAAAGFKRVLQARTDAVQSSQEDQKMIYGSSMGGVVSLDSKPLVYGDSTVSAVKQFPTLDLTSGMSAGESTTQLPRPHGTFAVGGGSNIYNTPGMRLRKSSSDLPTFSAGSSSLYQSQLSAPLTPMDMVRMEQESSNQQSFQLIPDQTYLRERADAMSTVESNIVELGMIFNKLAVMVSEHREMVQRVDDNVEDANTHINLSMNVLTDTLTNLQTNKALFMKVFGTLVAFIILFIVFFA